MKVDLEENEADLHVKYRWVADVPDFKMPVKVTTSTEHFDFIYPNGLAKLLHQDLGAHEFEVNEEEFFIEVE